MKGRFKMSPKKLGRRDFLKFTGIGTLALFGGSLKGLGRQPSLFDRRLLQMEPFMPDAEISITASEKFVQILSGAQTRVWGYEGKLLSGLGVTVQNLPGNYLGPILRVRSGTKVRIYFHNHLAEDSVVHPHGLRVPEDCDGQPMQAIGSGETKVYDFQ